MWKISASNYTVVNVPCFANWEFGYPFYIVGSTIYLGDEGAPHSDVYSYLRQHAIIERRDNPEAGWINENGVVYENSPPIDHKDIESALAPYLQPEIRWSAVELPENATTYDSTFVYLPKQDAVYRNRTQSHSMLIGDILHQEYSETKLPSTRAWVKEQQPVLGWIFVDESAYPKKNYAIFWSAQYGGTHENDKSPGKLANEQQALNALTREIGAPVEEGEFEAWQEDDQYDAVIYGHSYTSSTLEQVPDNGQDFTDLGVSFLYWNNALYISRGHHPDIAQYLTGSYDGAQLRNDTKDGSAIFGFVISADQNAWSGENRYDVGDGLTAIFSSGNLNSINQQATKETQLAAIEALKEHLPAIKQILIDSPRNPYQGKVSAAQEELVHASAYMARWMKVYLVDGASWYHIAQQAQAFIMSNWPKFTTDEVNEILRGAAAIVQGTREPSVEDSYDDLFDGPTQSLPQHNDPRFSNENWDFPTGNYLSSWIYQNGKLFIGQMSENELSGGEGHAQIWMNHPGELDKTQPLSSGWLYNQDGQILVSFYSGVLMGYGNREEDAKAWELLKQHYPDAIIWSNEGNERQMYDPDARHENMWFESNAAPYDQENDWQDEDKTDWRALALKLYDIGAPYGVQFSWDIDRVDRAFCQTFRKGWHMVHAVFPYDDYTYYVALHELGHAIFYELYPTDDQSVEEELWCHHFALEHAQVPISASAIAEAMKHFRSYDNDAEYPQQSQGEPSWMRTSSNDVIWVGPISLSGYGPPLENGVFAFIYQGGQIYAGLTHPMIARQIDRTRPAAYGWYNTSKANRLGLDNPIEFVTDFGHNTQQMTDEARQFLAGHPDFLTEVREAQQNRIPDPYEPKTSAVQERDNPEENDYIFVYDVNTDQLNIGNRSWYHTRYWPRGVSRDSTVIMGGYNKRIGLWKYNNSLPTDDNWQRVKWLLNNAGFETGEVIPSEDHTSGLDLEYKRIPYLYDENGNVEIDAQAEDHHDYNGELGQMYLNKLHTIDMADPRFVRTPPFQGDVNIVNGEYEIYDDEGVGSPYISLEQKAYIERYIEALLNSSGQNTQQKANIQPKALETVTLLSSQYTSDITHYPSIASLNATLAPTNTFKEHAWKDMDVQEGLPLPGLQEGTRGRLVTLPEDTLPQADRRGYTEARRQMYGLLNSQWVRVSSYRPSEQGARRNMVGIECKQDQVLDRSGQVRSSLQGMSPQETWQERVRGYQGSTFGATLEESREEICNSRTILHFSRRFDRWQNRESAGENVYVQRAGNGQPFYNFEGDINNVQIYPDDYDWSDVTYNAYDSQTNTLIGSIVGNLYDYGANDKYLYVSDLFVVPEYRQSSAFQLLFNALRKQFPIIPVRAFVINDRLQSIYQRWLDRMSAVNPFSGYINAFVWTPETGILPCYNHTQAIQSLRGKDIDPRTGVYGWTQPDERTFDIISYNNSDMQDKNNFNAAIKAMEDIGYTFKPFADEESSLTDTPIESHIRHSDIDENLEPVDEKPLGYRWAGAFWFDQMTDKLWWAGNDYGHPELIRAFPELKELLQKQRITTVESDRILGGWLVSYSGYSTFTMPDGPYKVYLMGGDYPGQLEGYVPAGTKANIIKAFQEQYGLEIESHLAANQWNVIPVDTSSVVQQYGWRWDNGQQPVYVDTNQKLIYLGNPNDHHSELYRGIIDQYGRPKTRNEGEDYGILYPDGTLMSAAAQEDIFDHPDYDEIKEALKNYFNPSLDNSMSGTASVLSVDVPEFESTVHETTTPKFKWIRLVHSDHGSGLPFIWIKAINIIFISEDEGWHSELWGDIQAPRDEEGYEMGRVDPYRNIVEIYTSSGQFYEYPREANQLDMETQKICQAILDETSTLREAATRYQFIHVATGASRIEHLNGVPFVGNSQTGELWYGDNLASHGDLMSHIRMEYPTFDRFAADVIGIYRGPGDNDFWECPTDDQDYIVHELENIIGVLPAYPYEKDDRYEASVIKWQVHILEA